MLRDWRVAGPLSSTANQPQWVTCSLSDIWVCIIARLPLTHTVPTLEDPKVREVCKQMGGEMFLSFCSFPGCAHVQSRGLSRVSTCYTSLVCAPPPPPFCLPQPTFPHHHTLASPQQGRPFAVKWDCVGCLPFPIVKMRHPTIFNSLRSPTQVCLHLYRRPYGYFGFIVDDHVTQILGSSSSHPGISGDGIRQFVC